MSEGAPVQQVADLSIKDKGKKEKKQKGKAVPVPLPEFIAHRIEVFDGIAARQAKPEPVPIKVTVLPEGDIIDGIAGETAPIHIAKDRGLAANVCTCKVNGVLCDLQVPLLSDASIEFFDFSSDEGQHVFWHSSAHILGQALEKKYACLLTIGPAIEQGYYYDAYMGDGAVVTADFKEIEGLVTRIIKDKQPFTKLVITKEEALDMFRENRFKVALINDKVADGDTCTVYRCGQLVDLCRGPHLTNTSRVKFSTVLKNSASYWLGNAANDSLQRVYGISFPTKDELKEYKELLAEAAKRDHRVVGTAQELFFSHQMSPGCAFFMPHGARIYNTLMNFMKDAYRQRGFDEVMTPNLYDAELWKTSGHWQNYKDNMFSFRESAGSETSKEFGLKPMNCPGHCLMYSLRQRSYRELPIRYADFGVLHRNEASGALTGLTRVRRFQQDDAHIFCRRDQVEQEMKGALLFVKYVYGTFGFEYRFVLSTRPEEKYMGEVSDWDEAESQLKSALEGYDWSLNEGDGAFYGPKIDIYIKDALKREHQCATIQLDFQLPKNFCLEYVPRADESGVPRPVIIHRAIYGSFERFFAILIEHTGGKWPFWLSPRQAMIVPVHAKMNEYGEQLKEKLHNAGFYVDLDASDRKMQKKVREAQLSQYNYILVIGEEEMNKQTVNIRTRDNVVHGEKSIDGLLEEWKEHIARHE